MKPSFWLSACAIAGSMVGGPCWAQPSSSVQDRPVAATSPKPSLAAERVPLRVALDAAWQRAVVAREAEGQLRRTDAERLASQSIWAAPPSLTLSAIATIACKAMMAPARPSWASPCHCGSPASVMRTRA